MSIGRILDALFGPVAIGLKLLTSFEAVLDGQGDSKLGLLQVWVAAQVLADGGQDGASPLGLYGRRGTPVDLDVDYLWNWPGRPPR